MKAILISPQYSFTPEAMHKAIQTANTVGITTLSNSAFLFDLAIASHLLANLQSFLADREYHYHLIYLRGEFDHFQYLGPK